MGMANNLAKQIARSGLTNKEVGKLAGGWTPETVSRHISGNINMTLSHAEDYARVLNCSPYDIMFEAKPMPIIGKCHLDEDGQVYREWSGKYYGQVYSHTYRPATTAIVHWTVDSAYTGAWNYWNKALESVLLDPIKDKIVHPEAHGHNAYALLENEVDFAGKKTRLVAGVLYPEPGGLFTVHNGDINQTLRSQKLEWATPVLSMILRPDLRGLQIIFDK